MRTLASLGILVCVLIISFLITLWLTEPGTAPDTTDRRTDAERLADRNISYRSDMVEAAVELGLHSSTAIKGNVDSISRVSDGDVEIKGWLADAGGDATPITVLIFVAGKKSAATQTQGERPDVAQALRLSSGAEQNVAFAAKFPCLAGKQPIIMGLGSDKQYFYLPSPPCP